MSLPPPAIGFRRTGETLTGTVLRDLVVRAGAKVTLRKIRPEADTDAEFVAVFERPERDTAAQLERDKAAADEAWHRRHLPAIETPHSRKARSTT